MKKKFWLPMMAVVFAIGLSFATERSTADANVHYVKVAEGEAIPIAAVNCGEENLVQCEGKFAGETTPYPIFEDEDLTTPVMGSSTSPINLPPRN